ncbi:hypothetical protein [Leptospira ilyithenensis]|uniref:Uncharacterized protein n=1 Tax=Leptospira ilyithenensis TaxID=2484901 RepID=A0A4R9LK64_9LEPT|nr:hypothetical protein [Leptospira ilyithenensis]TGN07976.1 hypothetical protein EHS11_13640 [Leptospira ilyithenensis]
MDQSFYFLFFPCISILIFVIFHIAIFRSVENISVLKSILAAYAIGLFSFLLIAAFVFSNGFLYSYAALEYLLCNYFFYSVMCFCYFCLINLTDTSLRLRMLYELKEKQSEGLSKEDMLKFYNANDIIKIRLEKLNGDGQILKTNDRYYHGKSRLILVAYFFEFLRIILIPKSQR